MYASSSEKGLGGAGGRQTVTALSACFFRTRRCKVVSNPRVYLADMLVRVVNGHLNRDIDDLLPGPTRRQSLSTSGERVRRAVASWTARMRPRGAQARG